MELETAETYEYIGSVVSTSFFVALGVNGVMNACFETLDYQALMDAIEVLQLISFIPAMNIKLPPNVNYFLAAVKEAVAVEPSNKMRPKGKSTIA